MPRIAVALVVTVLLVWGGTAPAMSAGNPFADVPRDHWAYDAIVDLATVGLVEGYPDGTFGGERSFTRYEMAMVFARTLARFEHLIDSTIRDSVGDRVTNLEGEVGDLWQELNDLRDELGAETEVVEETTIIRETVEVERPFELTDEAEAAINRLVVRLVREALADADFREDLRQQIEELQQQVTEVSRTEITQVVDAAVADKLAEVTGQVDSSLAAAQGDIEALWELLNSRTRSLESSIVNLSEEFRSELENLGVRLTHLEESVDELSRIANTALGMADTAQRSADAAANAAMSARQRADAAQEAADAAWDAMARADDTETARAVAEVSQRSADAAHNAAMDARSRATAAQSAADEALAAAERARTEGVAAGERAAHEANRAQIMARGAQTAAQNAHAAADRAQATADEALALAQEVAEDLATGLRITGTIGADYERIAAEGGPVDASLPERFLRDPRNSTAPANLVGGDVWTRTDVFKQTLQLDLAAQPQPGVEFTSSLGLVTHLFGGPADTSELEVDTLRMLLASEDSKATVDVGELDEDAVAAGFNRYTLDADAFGDDKRGALLTGAKRGLTSNLVATRLGEATYFHGFSLEVPLGDMLSVDANYVNHVEDLGLTDTPPHSRAADSIYSVGLSGELAGIDFAALLAQDRTSEASAIDTSFGYSIGSFDLRATYGSVGDEFGLTGPQVDPADDEAPVYRDSYLGKRLDADDELVPDQAEYTLGADWNLARMVAHGTYGHKDTRVSLSETDTWYEAGVRDFHLGPFETALTYRSGTDHNDDATVQAMLFEADGAFQFIAPLNLELAFGSEGSGLGDRDSHSRFKVTAEEYPVGQYLALEASYETIQTVITNSKWRNPANWTDRDTSEIAAKGTVTLFEALDLFAGHRILTDTNTAWDSKSITTAGVGYGFGLMGAAVTVGLEHEIASEDSQQFEPKNTLKAGVARDLMGGAFELNAKAIQGRGDDGADHQGALDTIIDYNLTYPIVRDVDLVFSGDHVRSTNNPDSDDDYKVDRFGAGISFDF